MAKEDFLDYPEFIEEAQRVNQISLNPTRSTSGPSSWTNPRTGATYSVASGGELALAKKIRDDRSNVLGMLDFIDDTEQAIEDIEEDIGDLQGDISDIETALGTKQDIDAGVTASRPVSPTTGQMFFDTTLGIPIWWNGTIWVDATGMDADY